MSNVRSHIHLQEQVAVLQAELDVAKKKGAPSADDVLELSKNSAKSNAKLERLNFFSAQGRWLALVSIVASAFCLYVCVNAFRLWYVRVQQPQDRLLQLQLLEAEKKAALTDAT
jgi:hypothetical protein